VEPLVFYFDRNVGKRLPEALKLLQLKNVDKVFHHNTERKLVGGLRSSAKLKYLFKPDEQDDVWLEFVGRRGWIVFTQDKKFHRDGYENEISAIKQFNVGCFYLWGADAPTALKALVFLKSFDRIMYAIVNTPRPFIYDISKSGKLTSIPIP
jgi:hypothetical protein